MALVYLSAIARKLKMHPNSLYQIRRDYRKRGIRWPEGLELPDGKLLYDEEEFLDWYAEHVVPNRPENRGGRS